MSAPRSRSSRRRAGQGGSWWLAQFGAQGGLCAWCLQVMPADRSELAVDHLVPLALGGMDKVQNKCLMHAACNHEKATLGLRERPA